MSIPGLSQLKSQFTRFFEKIRPIRPLPDGFDYEGARKKLEFVYDEIDKLVDKYDESYIQTKKHPDVIKEMKIQIVAALITKYHDSLDQKPPFSTYAIEELFDAMYKEVFVNCILPEGTIPPGPELTESHGAFERLIGAHVGPHDIGTLELVNPSSQTAKEMFELLETPQLRPIINPPESQADASSLMKNDRKFRDRDEAVNCMIVYNREKIKFLNAQYDLLENYLKQLYCEHMTAEERLKFSADRKYRLSHIKCNPDTKTPGSFEKLFSNFSELLLNVENSKKGLEANAMSI